MKLHARGHAHKFRKHDLVGAEIDLARTVNGYAGHHDGFRSVDIADTGLEAIRIDWVHGSRKGIGAGSYDFSLELTYADIARLFSDAFGERSLSDALRALATAKRLSHTRLKPGGRKRRGNAPKP